MTTDQTTPTSSLEEARQSLVRCEACKGRGGFSDTSMGRGGFAGQMLTVCRVCSGSGIDTRELEAFIAAAARAEVIREVEALMREGDEIDPRYRAWESIRPYPTDGGVITFPRFKAAWDRLRALSQGGEEEA